jgi:RNA polymerase sigma factor for flagellar operon FliA
LKPYWLPKREVFSDSAAVREGEVVMDDRHLLDDASRCPLILEYIETVRRIAYGMARTLPRDVSVDDLIGAGLVGLAEALKKLKGRSRGEVDAYVACRVRGAITDELRHGDPLTRPMRQFAKRKEIVGRELTGKLGRSPDESEIAVKMGMSLARYREQVRHSSFRRVTSIDPVTGTQADGSEFSDGINEAADVVAARTEQHERLAKALATLPARLRSVLRMYYEQDRSLREIGTRLGLTESRACQLRRDAINALRSFCVSDDVQDAESRFAHAS